MSTNSGRGRVGFTCGAFDLLHPGHVLLLEDAKDQCDHLIVGLHIDPSLQRHDKNSPVQTIEERLVVLQAIKYVDHVVIYRTEGELANILDLYMPDVRIIGTDWDPSEITKGKVDIPIHWHKRTHKWSTSDLRRRVYEKEECRRGGNCRCRS